MLTKKIENNCSKYINLYSHKIVNGINYNCRRISVSQSNEIFPSSKKTFSSVSNWEIRRSRHKLEFKVSIFRIHVYIDAIY